MSIETQKIANLKPDSRNANKGTQRGLQALDDSLRQFGAGRSILVDKAGRVIAGNKTLACAADVGMEDVIVVESDGTKLIAVKRTDLDLDSDDGKARKLAYADNRVAELDLDWDVDALQIDLNDGLDLSNLWDESELSSLLDEQAELQHRIGRSGRLYDGSDIEPYKLAHRVEAIWQARGNLALDLFSGSGQLASWYRRRFERVVTNDKNMPVGDVDFSLPVLTFIEKHLLEFINFDFVDFDDEGCPAVEIRAFFELISGKKAESFVLALIDGNGLNLKCRGLYDFSECYLRDEPAGKRRATRADYDDFERYVTDFVSECAKRSGFGAMPLSSYRGRHGNVVYQTWLIEPSNGPDRA